MRRIILYLLMVIAIAVSAQDQKTTKLVYQFDIKEMIAPAMWRQTKLAFEEAEKLGADIILIHMNTYGGMVLDADSIRSRILRSKIPVHVFIDNNAASAGALISISCDSIFMSPGASIGAATVVDQSGEKMPDKYQSYMRATMRSTAEAKHRDPQIAQAMVDESVYIPGLIDSLHVLTFSTKEAIEHGFCEGEVNSVEEVMEKLGISDYTIHKFHPGAIDKVIDFFLNPFLSSILIMVIIGGIYFELQTPGVGFPLIASCLAAIMYFAPLYLQGLAENWEILMFVVGCVLLLLEIFVIPGFGVAGILGIIGVVMGLALSLLNNIGFNFTFIEVNDVIKALSLVIISFFLSIGGSLYLSSRLLGFGMFRKLVLTNDPGSYRANLEEKEKTELQLIGKKGIASTVLRPSGKVEINDDIYDAFAETGYIEKGTEIVVIRYEAAQLIVGLAG
ncbi:MAG: nodulation protein NfeD [Flavobacteriales bacterium]|nr:nodulation protein NfeD [Flavobacteriales bacterium]